MNDCIRETKLIRQFGFSYRFCADVKKRLFKTASRHRATMVVLSRKNARQYSKSVNYSFQIASNDISTLLIGRSKKLRLFGKYTTDSLKTSQISQELNILLMLRMNVLLDEEIVRFH